MTTLSGTVTLSGNAQANVPVLVVDTSNSSDPSNWSLAATAVTDSNGDWSVSGLADGATERYHAIVQFDDGSGNQYNALSKPYLSTPSAIPDSGVLRYNFEQDLADAWNSNDGTNNGGTFSTTAKWGSYALSLDGVDDYVEYPEINATGPSQAWSVSMFLNLQSLPSSEWYFLWHPRAESDSGIFVDYGEFGSKGEVVYLTYDGSVNPLLSGYTLSTDSYIQIGASNDGSGNYSVVVDGTVQNSGTLPDPSSRSGANKIGAQPDSEGRYTDGLIDRFDIYSKQLSSTEWSNLASTGSING